MACTKILNWIFRRLFPTKLSYCARLFDVSWRGATLCIKTFRSYCSLIKPYLLLFDCGIKLFEYLHREILSVNNGRDVYKLYALRCKCSAINVSLQWLLYLKVLVLFHTYKPYPNQRCLKWFDLARGCFVNAAWCWKWISHTRLKVIMNLHKCHTTRTPLNTY